MNHIIYVFTFIIVYLIFVRPEKYLYGAFLAQEVNCERNHAQYYIKLPVVSTILVSIIGGQNLLLAEGNEHERERLIINTAFHINLKSMVSIITDRIAKTIQSIDLQLLLNL